MVDSVYGRILMGTKMTVILRHNCNHICVSFFYITHNLCEFSVHSFCSFHYFINDIIHISVCLETQAVAPGTQCALLGNASRHMAELIG